MNDNDDGLARYLATFRDVTAEEIASEKALEPYQGKVYQIDTALLSHFLARGYQWQILPPRIGEHFVVTNVYDDGTCAIKNIDYGWHTSFVPVRLLVEA